jgi:pyrroline-5-carboxylate reductase
VHIKLQVIGGGKMGEALLGGLVAEGWATASELAVLEPLPERREQLRGILPGVEILDGPLAETDALLAVKPDHVPSALESLRGKSVPRLLSIAAGVRTTALEAGLDSATAVIRAMPNTPALVAAGAAAIAAGRAATAADLDWAASVLGAVGTVEGVTEDLLDAVTALSGSGPAYLFLLAEHMMAAGTAAGLPTDVAERLTKQTLLGASRLLAESPESAAQLRINVTSPGGTTAAALGVFESEDFGGAVARAIEAARARSVELGE